MRAHLARLRVNAAIRAAVVAMGISTTAVPVAAQGAAAESPTRRDTSSLPFHDDQWGMDFGVSGGSTYRIGAVRFTSPTRAWILDGRINGRIDREQYWAGDDTSMAGLFPPNSDAINQGGSVSLLVGRRAYRGMGPRAMRTVSFGIGGGFGYDEYLRSGVRMGRLLSWSGTSEFAVGGHYRVTPSLALGATLRLAATYTASESRPIAGGPRVRKQIVGVGLGSSDLVLSLFF